MARTRRAKPADKYASAIRTMRLTNLVLVLVVLALVIYIVLPSLNLVPKVQVLGNTTAGIDTPLSSAQLAAINGAPNSYFENAAQIVMNASIPGEQVGNNVYLANNFQISLNPSQQVSPFMYNNKPSVIYVGATSCIWCGESRWAMALALSRFGNFNALYTGYSAVGDGDVPTLFWSVDNITSSKTTFGNQYSSNYINFFTTEYDSNILQGFQLPAVNNPIGYFASIAPNQSYHDALRFMNATNQFSGTPFTVFGTTINKGAAAIVFGVATNKSTGSSPPLTYMTHREIFGQLKSFNSTFAIEEYAAADVYIAQICHSIGNSASICSEPAIRTFEQRMGLS